MLLQSIVPWDWRSRAAPQELLPLWTISEEGFVVSTEGGYSVVYALEGIDATHMAASDLAQGAAGFYKFFGGAEEGLRLQFLQHSHANQEELFELLDTQEKSGNEVLDYQQETQTAFLKRSLPRAIDLYLVVSLAQCEGTVSSALSAQEHDRRAELVEKAGADVIQKLKEALPDRDSQRQAISGRRLSAEEVTVLYRKLLAPGTRGTHSKYLNRDSHGRSVRSQLFTTNLEWNKESLQLGEGWVRVLSLLNLEGQQTEFASVLCYLDQAYDYLLSFTVEVPKQTQHKQTLELIKNTSYVSSVDRGGRGDEAAESAFAQARGLLANLREEKLQMVTICAQVALFGEDEEALDKLEGTFKGEAREKVESVWVPETHGHHYAYPRMLPGLSGFSDRKLLVTSRNAADLAPLAGINRGDRRPVLVFFSTRDTPIAYDPVCPKRTNRNAFIVGSSGSGKSVLANSLILAACSANTATRGRTLVIDNAGADASSYRQVADLVGGDYVEIVHSEFGINPFPDKLTKTREKSLLGLLLLVLQSEEQGRGRQLEEAILQKAVKVLYQKKGEKPANFETFLAALKALQKTLTREEVKARGQALVDTLERELSLGNMEVFLRPTKNQDQALRIVDLKGLGRFEPYIQGAIVYSVCSLAWELMLEVHETQTPPRYVILDEVAQLVRNKAIRELIQELYATARKHNGSIWGITQQYADFRKSDIASAIVGNSTSQFIMQAADHSQVGVMAEDFGLNDREQALIKGLGFKKGEGGYSEALLRTYHYNELTRESLRQSTKVRLKLSPFSLMCTTSDAGDRQRRLRLEKQYPEYSQKEILALMARGGGA